MTVTKRLSTTSDDIAIAADILNNGGLVAMPTETVYGLAADATNPDAVANIYTAKGRPSFNPLIVHVSDITMAERFVVVSDTAKSLADAFWPGPLTIVLPLKPDAPIAPAVTAGLATLAIRCPDHPTAQALITASNLPLAAPSANPSGKISATTADHVLDGLHGRIDAVLDAGPCDVGVESTIVTLSPSPKILRHGGVATDALHSITGLDFGYDVTPAQIAAPGQMQSHYAPSSPIRLNVTTPTDNENYLGFGPMACAMNLSETGDLEQAATNLFAALHQLDQRNKSIAVAPIPNTGIGIAINDRLNRAAAPKGADQ